MKTIQDKHPQKRLPTIKDGNGYEIPAYPRILNPMGAGMGLDLCPRVRARVQI
jgi:hypothetical protein